jgi:hypothetical protein
MSTRKVEYELKELLVTESALLRYFMSEREMLKIMTEMNNSTMIQIYTDSLAELEALYAKNKRAMFGDDHEFSTLEQLVSETATN